METAEWRLVLTRLFAANRFLLVFADDLTKEDTISNEALLRYGTVFVVDSKLAGQDLKKKASEISQFLSRESGLLASGMKLFKMSKPRRTLFTCEFKGFEVPESQKKHFSEIVDGVKVQISGLSIRNYESGQGIVVPDGAFLLTIMRFTRDAFSYIERDRIQTFTAEISARFVKKDNRFLILQGVPDDFSSDDFKTLRDHFAVVWSFPGSEFETNDSKRQTCQIDIRSRIEKEK